ncbi:hypothetical protein QN277_022365 [Acacia crassicarpa]|uniref:Uncharacterized protein n=1 Tax=Acacia crassicarpa TaxID=499986 RepID=A0AAE1JJ03_9FABA|nr:hypothetical protein QN277_022365 [Acacia crassicarpa]
MLQVTAPLLHPFSSFDVAVNNGNFSSGFWKDVSGDNEQKSSKVSASFDGGDNVISDAGEFLNCMAKSVNLSELLQFFQQAQGEKVA